MRLTKEEGRALLGAIRAEIESMYWRQQKRESNGYDLYGQHAGVERHLREMDEKRKVVLRDIHDKIQAQL